MNIVTVFRNIKEIDQPFYRSSSDILDRIKNGASKGLVNLIRLEEDKETKQELKKGLPSICFSGKFRTRYDSEIIEHSGLICLDFDGYKSVDEMEAAKRDLSSDKYSYAVFVSPSGNGIKVIVKIPNDVDNHSGYFNALEEYYNDPEHFDTTSKNLSRVCYESFDPDIYVNEESEVWTEFVKVDFKEVNKGHDVVTVPITDDNKIVEILVSWWHKKFPMISGQRNQNAYVLASALNDYGIDKSTAMDVLLNYVQGGKDGFSQREIETTVDSAYSKVENHGTKYYEDEEKLDKLRGEMRNGASKEDIVSDLVVSNIDQDMANAIVDRVEKEVRGDKFWKKNDKGKVSIIHIAFKRFLEKNGFFKYNPEDSVNYVFVRIQNNLIDHTTDKKIKTFVLDYLLELGDDSVYNYFAENTKYFKEDFLTLLGSANIEFIYDQKEYGYLYFKNTAVRITTDGPECIDYIDLGGYVWKNHIIDRDFIKTDSIECDFKQFVWNISFSTDERFKSMISAIGYLLHGYKPPKDCPSIILNDEKISDNPEGGTGKGLIMKAISKLKRVVVIDGKTFNFDKSFPYQLVSADTQIVVFDDVKKRFDFERLFSVVTEGMTLEKKNKDAIRLQFSRSPKISITTNYAIKGSGNSFDRRKWELELHQYYTKDRTPYEEFGKYMFNEWDSSEWSRFHNFMVYCLSFYLKNGLVKSEFVNLKVRKLSAQTCHEFIEWCGVIDNQAASDVVSMLRQGHKVHKPELYNDFTSEYPDFAPKARFTISRTRFYRWVSDFCVFLGGKRPEEGRDSNGRWIRMRIKHEDEFNSKINFKE